MFSPRPPAFQNESVHVVESNKANIDKESTVLSLDLSSRALFPCFSSSLLFSFILSPLPLSLSPSPSLLSFCQCTHLHPSIVYTAKRSLSVSPMDWVSLVRCVSSCLGNSTVYSLADWQLASLWMEVVMVVYGVHPHSILCHY